MEKGSSVTGKLRPKLVTTLDGPSVRCRTRLGDWVGRGRVT